MLKESVISGTIVDPVQERIFEGTIKINNGHIVDISEGIVTKLKTSEVIVPGLVDSHIHIESSMLMPAEFARATYKSGTVAVLCDPHEIANVLGIDGVEYFIENSKSVPTRLYFCAPSCVPATTFETNGATLGTDEIERLLQKDEVPALGEVMNVPGVLNDDPELMQKIAIAKKYNKQVDGHAPLLTGDGLMKYVSVGITTDHECSTIEEAEEKIKAGMMIQIREGSAARNFEALFPLISKYPDKCMLCSDDKHPDSLDRGHLDVLIRRALENGVSIINVLKTASVNPVRHYGMKVGLLQKGDPADFIIVDNLENFNIQKTYINGKIITDKDFTDEKIVIKNKFEAELITPENLVVPSEAGNINIIAVEDGQLLTAKLLEEPKITNSQVVSDPARDILKIVVVNRYQKSKPVVGFIMGFGLKKGAIVSSVAHDSHNIIAVGTTDEAICTAINELIKTKGGLCVVDDENGTIVFPLPIAGIVSDQNYKSVQDQYRLVEEAAKGLGSKLTAPFMTLSFMALLVIPTLKIGDRGLFDGEKFKFVKLFVKR